jgi:hypothetical protein
MLRIKAGMAPLDLTSVLKNAPIGEWIALSYGRDRVVATAQTLAAAIKAASDAGELHPIMMKIPAVSALVL